VRAGQLPALLPPKADFNGAAKRLAQSYEISWLACRYVASRYGQPALVRFYRSVGRSHRATAAAVRVGLHQVLGLTPREFTAGWQAYLESQLTA
jgi:hypothetical protein